MMALACEPVFWLGMLAGFLACFIFLELEKKKQSNNFYSFKSTGEEIIKMYQNTGSIDLYKLFPKEKYSDQIGYKAFASLACWLANVYYECTYQEAPISDFWGAANTIFCGVAVIKLEALNELLNRSTFYLKYYAGRISKDANPQALHKMVFLIIDSYKSVVYHNDLRR